MLYIKGASTFNVFLTITEIIYMLLIQYMLSGHSGGSHAQWHVDMDRARN